MSGSSRHPCSLEQPRTSSLDTGDRNKKKNYTSKLQELALLIPLNQKPGSKKLTKKEILLHVLHYIQYLQRSIEVVKALLRLHLGNEEGELGEPGWPPAVTGPGRQKHSTPSSSPCSQDSHLWGACQKPRKKKPPQGESGLQTWTPKSRRSLGLNTPEKLVTPSDQKEDMGRTATPPSCPDTCDPPEAVLSSTQEGNGDEEARAQLLLEMAKDIDFEDITSSSCTNGAQDDEPDPAFKDENAGETICFLSETPFYPRQQMVFYDSSEEVDSEVKDADPWLPVCTPEGSPQESLLALPPPQVPTWSSTGHPGEILGLSPSLFSSPSRLLSKQILEDDAMFLNQGLFEEVLLDPESPPAACVLAAPQEKDAPSGAPTVPPDFYSLCQSSVSLDHCYLALGDNGKAKALSSPSSEDSDTDSLWEQESDPKGSQSSKDEDNDYMWTPTRQASALSAAGKKNRKGQAGKAPVKPKEAKKASCPPQVKKKCVNGFIMFCRMNRRPYIRACPGTASTAATKELAQLWRVMTQKERRPYCIKARRFSRQHNRIVKQESSDSSDEDWETPKPFYQLLAEKAQASQDPASTPPPHD